MDMSENIPGIPSRSVLQVARLRWDISQKELGAAVGCDQSIISQLENQTYEFANSPILQRIADAVGWKGSLDRLTGPWQDSYLSLLTPTKPKPLRDAARIAKRGRPKKETK